MELLFKTADEIIEELIKKCPRCGSASANKGNPAGRCSSCLDKLSANKKKPGHYLHEHKLADDALRRQDGKNGTASKKSKGRGSRKEIIGKVRSAYAKHGKGKTLSPDRKDNSEGYSSSNTRMVPKELNRGRHKVDSKKLKAWQKKLKKSGIECDAFSKAIEAGDLDQAITELELIKTKFISPEQQKANRLKAKSRSNENAFAESGISPGNKRTYNANSPHKMSHSDVDKMNHAGIAADIHAHLHSEGSEHIDNREHFENLEQAHRALAAHKDGSKPLNEIQARRHKNTILAHHNDE